MRDQQIDLLLGGRIRATDPELGALVRFVSATSASFVRAPSAEVRTAHLAAMAEAFGEPSTTPAPTPPRRRRRRFGARLAAATAGTFLLAGSALAATGNLPDAVQDGVANVLNRAGIHVPKSDDNDAGTTDTTQDGESKSKGAENANERSRAKWAACVSAAAAVHDSEGPGNGAFDPEEACGPKPANPSADRPDRTPNANSNRGGASSDQGNGQGEGGGSENGQSGKKLGQDNGSSEDGGQADVDADDDSSPGGRSSSGRGPSSSADPSGAQQEIDEISH